MVRRLLWIAGIGVASLWVLFIDLEDRETDRLNYSQFVALLRESRGQSSGSWEVTISGNRVKGRYSLARTENARSFEVTIPEDAAAQIANTLVQQGAVVRLVPDDNPSWFLLILSTGTPLLLILGVGFWLKGKIQSGRRGALNFGKHQAKLHTCQQEKVTFKDVGGVEEAKEELQEIVAFLREPEKSTRLGARLPRGILLTGPPGTGKTLLARAVAGEAGVLFFSVNGSEFVEIFVGVGASRIRDLFKQGRRHAPCIVFLDEIDAVGRRRGGGLGGGNDEREQALNQLLTEMDGFEPNPGVILMAATNRPDILDPALLRPGRFDRQVEVPLPDSKGREAMLRIHSRRIPLSEDVDIPLLARSTSGFSGAQLANLTNEAALIAAHRCLEQVSMAAFEEARDNALMGRARRSLVISEKEKLSTAYHEAGHALVGSLLPDADPIYKVTIVPRGRLLGVTARFPEEDVYNQSREHIETLVATLLAGRCAEEVFLNEFSTGACDDLHEVTELARKMVCEWGMSEELGPLNFGQDEVPVFLGRVFTRRERYSRKTALKIDQEIERIVLKGYAQARHILHRHRRTVVRLVEALLELETLDLRAVEAIVGLENG